MLPSGTIKLKIVQYFLCIHFLEDISFFVGTSGVLLGTSGEDYFGFKSKGGSPRSPALFLGFISGAIFADLLVASMAVEPLFVQ